MKLEILQLGDENVLVKPANESHSVVFLWSCFSLFLQAKLSCNKWKVAGWTVQLSTNKKIILESFLGKGQNWAARQHDHSPFESSVPSVVCLRTIYPGFRIYKTYCRDKYTWKLQTQASWNELTDERPVFFFFFLLNFKLWSVDK